MIFISKFSKFTTITNVYLAVTTLHQLDIVGIDQTIGRFVLLKLYLTYLTGDSSPRTFCYSLQLLFAIVRI